MPPETIESRRERDSLLSSYVVTLLIFGVIVLLTTWLPLALKRIPLSLPICCIAIGMLLTWSPFTPLPRFNPLDNTRWAEHLTELVVIVALMGAGLKIDRALGWRRWMITWRLLGIAMPISIAGIALLGWWLLKLPPASALLLGAALAPTDPVLAAEIQVGPPHTGEEDDIRFALTSEAGLNDGLSFPFIMAAIAMTASDGQELIGRWLAFDVVWRLVAGVGVGWLIGDFSATLPSNFLRPDGSQKQGTAWLHWDLPSCPMERPNSSTDMGLLRCSLPR